MTARAELRCAHDVTEREVAAVADGLCPLCLQAELAAALSLLIECRPYVVRAKYWAGRDDDAVGCDNASALLARMPEAK